MFEGGNNVVSSSWFLKLSHAFIMRVRQQDEKNNFPKFYSFFKLVGSELSNSSCGAGLPSW